MNREQEIKEFFRRNLKDFGFEAKFEDDVYEDFSNEDKGIWITVSDKSFRYSTNKIGIFYLLKDIEDIFIEDGVLYLSVFGGYEIELEI